MQASPLIVDFAPAHILLPMIPHWHKLYLPWPFDKREICLVLRPHVPEI